MPPMITDYFLVSYDPGQVLRQKKAVGVLGRRHETDVDLRKVGDGASRRRLIRLLSAGWLVDREQRPRR
jgi:hypothetical protein